MSKKKNKPAKLNADVIKNLQESMNDQIKKSPKERKNNGKKHKKEKSSNRSS